MIEDLLQMVVGCQGVCAHRQGQLCYLKDKTLPQRQTKPQLRMLIPMSAPCGCCHKLLQLWWLQTIGSYSQSVEKNQTHRNQGKITIPAGNSPFRGLEEEPGSS